MEYSRFSDQMQVFDKLVKYLDIAVLTETKKKVRGVEEIGNYIHIYSGVEKEKRAKCGVSAAIYKKLKNYILGWEEVDERIVTVHMKLYDKNVIIIGIYALTNDATQ